MSLNILVDCPVRSQFYISFTFIYTSNQKKKKLAKKDILN